MPIRVAIAMLAAALTAQGGTPPRSSPARCPATTQVQVVRSLVAAFNAGNAGAVNRLVAPEPAFQWFSAIGPDERIGKRAEDRSTLGTYIRRRHRHHDHLTLVGFGSTDDQGRINLTLLIRRRADDYHPRNLLSAKQDTICGRRGPSVIVWSM